MSSKPLSPVPILHTEGGRGGEPRQSPLPHLQDGDDHVIVGSRRGAAAEGKAACRPRLTAGYRFYDDYRARTARDIPVIVLTPAGAGT
jgi:hypothetical protein